MTPNNKLNVPQSNPSVNSTQPIEFVGALIRSNSNEIKGIRKNNAQNCQICFNKYKFRILDFRLFMKEVSC